MFLRLEADRGKGFSANSHAAQGFCGLVSPLNRDRSPFAALTECSNGNKCVYKRWLLLFCSPHIRQLLTDKKKKKEYVSLAKNVHPTITRESLP